MSEGFERRRDCETAGRAGAGLARKEDVPNLIYFESWINSGQQDTNEKASVSVSGTVPFLFCPFS